MTVMVTGIGHVGGYVVRDLLDAGERVVLYGFFGGTGDPADLFPPDLQFVDQLVGGGLRDKTEIVVGDVADLDALVDVMERYEVTKVVHLASLLSAGVEANPPLAARVNVVGMANVLEAASRLNLKKVVWASSVDVFGDGSADASGVVTDDAPYDPPFIYGATKVMGEQMAWRYAENHGLSITGLRLTRGYGFGEHIKSGRGAGSSWMTGLLYEPAVGSGVEVVVPFGARYMDFLYLEDVSDAFLKALSRVDRGSRNYIIRGDFRRVSDAFDFVHSLFPDAPLSTVMEDAPLPPGSSLAWERRYDGSRATAEIGYQSKFSLEDGLLRTINLNRASVGLEPVVSPESEAEVEVVVSP
ncbi:NAD-dependent epimerase/dehydratase family protein [Saccharopolyspora mangrovi]|uniref:NAD(P)-dependent oxidoreductase n=1 Tax=Saccharopolyspora mangrovi TaxID=3082379 RepID=A0ABU6AK25_9PSEU|nr:NAD(P)-dependent oxidoreductase [Saccharopolyspora sp. S2-29]MEB3371885.1 NAD(P)-dependent oxidoreductase [Saccharopolyspora sp. S2-29]